MRVDWTDGYVMEQGVWLLGGHLPVMGFGLVQVEKTTSTMSIVFSNTGKYNPKIESCYTIFCSKNAES